MIDRQAEAKTIAEFKRLEIGWTMLLDDGWWAYYNDEKSLGPFPTEGEAAWAGLEGWGKETASGGWS
jgi:alpha-galactosidase